MLAIAGSNFAARDMIALRRPLSIVDSYYFAWAIACSNYVAAVDMTSRQQSLSAIAGGNFAAVDMMSLRRPLPIAESHYFVQPSLAAPTSLQSM